MKQLLLVCKLKENIQRLNLSDICWILFRIEEKVNIVYKRALEKTLRSPKYVCDLFREIYEQQYELNFYSRENCQYMLVEYQEITGGKIKVNWFVDREKCLEIINNAEFIIVGDGTESKRVLNFCEDNYFPNFTCKNRVSQSEYEEMLRSIDVGLISLNTHFTISNIPSKLLTYFKLKSRFLQ